MLHEIATILTGIAMIAGAASLLLGLWRLLALRRRRAASSADRVRPLAQVLAGIGILLETVPRLAGWPAAVVFTCSMVALLPLAGFLVLAFRAARA